MKPSHLLSFLCGALVMLGVGMVRQSNAQSPAHVYELRVYHANPGKLDALVARFRNDTERIFRKHNVNAIGYWIPEVNKDNLLIYVVQHDSKAAADKNWAAFQADPEWQKVRTASEANGAITDHIDSTFMDPTDFSKLK
jgi:hypothetical protein